MKVLIKVGGTLLDESATRAGVAEQLAWAATQCQLAVVHGGGTQVTRFLQEREIRSEFVNGLRVSDENVIEAVTKVIAGGVNKQLVAALTAAHCAAVGISGVDGGLVTATPLSTEMKFTGIPKASKGKLLDLLISGGYLPVVACIAGDQEGNIYNVNADQLAVSCAVGWGADKLFFLTDVPGVKGASGETMSHLNPSDVRSLISSGVAHGGMQTKLESCVLALKGGLDEVVIAPGQANNICRNLLAGRPPAQSMGTRINLQKPGAA